MGSRRRTGARELNARAVELDLFGTVAEPAGAGTSASAVVDVAEDEQYDRRRSAAGVVAEPLAIPGVTPESAVAVGTVTRAAKDVLEGAFLPLWVHGEVSDFKAHRNGHWYFCLRDESSQLRCVVWSRDRRASFGAIQDGLQVAAFGRLTVYAARGEMQFSVTRLETRGDGMWRKALELTLSRLAADGLLAPERKRPLPRLPRCVAVVTSPDGAALRDIIAVLRRRCPSTSIVVVPAAVQGEGAPAELVAALERVGRWRGADTVIVGRGGGAREDLWAFNDERVARAVAGCPIPTISAVGHEVDVTLCDLVADHRAATPSAAAEAAVPVAADLAAELHALRAALEASMRRRLGAAAGDVERATAQLGRAAERSVERRRARVDAMAGRLHALSPLAVLARGYAVARSIDGRTLGRAASFSAGEPFDLLLHDGTVRATTDAVRSGDR